MTSRPIARRWDPAPRRRSLLTPWTVGAGLTALALAVSLAIVVSNETRSAQEAEAAFVETGERSDMGMPVIETPGAATGTARAGVVEVEAAEWDLGTVPLDTAVRPTWLLRNTGTEPVTIGEPHPEVREGCCPGPFTLTSRTIGPGEASTLSFELSMHTGMDGWHDIAVHVPVQAGGAQDALTLGVTGDFRDV
jgi:hypothetical protein